IGMAAAALTRVFRPPRLQRPEAVEFKSTKNDPSVSKTTVPEDDITVEGRYSNFDYAYSVLVPKGMMAAGSPAPNPNHGFGIDLMHPTPGRQMRDGHTLIFGWTRVMIPRRMELRALW